MYYYAHSRVVFVVFVVLYLKFGLKILIFTVTAIDLMLEIGLFIGLFRGMFLPPPPPFTPRSDIRTTSINMYSSFENTTYKDH